MINSRDIDDLTPEADASRDCRHESSKKPIPFGLVASQAKNMQIILVICAAFRYWGNVVDTKFGRFKYCFANVAGKFLFFAHSKKVSLANGRGQPSLLFYSFLVYVFGIVFSLIDASFIHVCPSPYLVVLNSLFLAFNIAVLTPTRFATRFRVWVEDVRCEFRPTDYARPFIRRSPPGFFSGPCFCIALLGAVLGRPSAFLLSIKRGKQNATAFTRYSNGCYCAI